MIIDLEIEIRKEIFLLARNCTVEGTALQVTRRKTTSTVGDGPLVGSRKQEAYEMDCCNSRVM